jgi:hypothetical protein
MLLKFTYLGNPFPSCVPLRVVAVARILLSHLYRSVNLKVEGYGKE